MPSVGALKRLGRPVLRALGLRPPAYRGRVRHGEVAMDDVEIHGLVRALRSVTPPALCVVEIGSYCGGSTVVIARTAARRAPGARVFAIEPFSAEGARYQRNYESLFDANVADWSVGTTIEKVRTTSDAAAPGWKRPIDFLYVDGDHSYDAVVRDVRNFVPFVREGGVFAFHDYKPGKDGVRRAVDELVAPYHAKLFQAGSLAVFRKRAPSA
jgi:predicted O-methyltransferase YrrM